MIAICLLLLLEYVLGIRTGTTLPNIPLSLPITIDNRQVSSSLVIDANWRWLNGDFLEGQGDVMAMQASYGVRTNLDAVTLDYVTVNSYGTNVGSRLYLLDGSKYYGFNLVGRELAFDVSLDLPCGINAAVYLVEMPSDGGLDARFGTGYFDAQCPTDLRVLPSGILNSGKGVCGTEMDLFEGNKYAMQFAPHVCKGPPLVQDKQPPRYQAYCDMDGADYNPYRNGNKSFYGPGKTIDSTKPFTVITRFHEVGGKLAVIERLYSQNNKEIFGANMTDETIASQKQKFGEINRHAQLGGLEALGVAFKRGKMTLVLSLWDDGFAKMAWLDGVYPPGGTAPGNLRGPCPPGVSEPVDLRKKFPKSKVTYSNIRVSTLQPIALPEEPSVPLKKWVCQSCVYQ